MNDEQYFLANAYLDGELTADERRIAEADPEVMAEVEQLRALQSELRDVPGPSADVRESAIGAAMAAFAGAGEGVDAPAAEPAPHAAPVVPFRRRPPYAKLLGVAAAVVAVAGLGIIVSQAGLGDDDSSDVADSAEPAVDRDGAFTESVGDSEGMAAELAPADDAADDAADEAADDAGGADTADEVLAADDGEVTAQPGADDSADMSSATADDPEGDSAPAREVPDDFDPSAPISDDAELGVYGAYLIGLRNAGELPPTPNHKCVEARQILDEATLVLDDAVVPVYIDVREADGLVAALRTDSCVEVLVGSLSAE